jgi:hypothetical protein
MRASRVVLGVAAVAVIAAAAGQDSVAAPAARQRPLVLTSFVQNGRTDLWRNEILEFKFSARLRRGSVDERTLQIGRLTTEGFVPDSGARVVFGNVVLFDTRRTQANYDALRYPNAPYVEADRPDGLLPNSRYVVRIPTAPTTRVLKSCDGRAIVQPFTGGFSTTHWCIDAREGQPSFVGDHGTGLLGFDPPRSSVVGLVESYASIVLEFSEPVLESSLVPGTTVLVTRVVDGAPIAGTIAVDGTEPSGRRFVFSPTGGFGTDGFGYGRDVLVRLTKGITDLAGNPLQREIGPVIFRTRAPE